MNRAALTPQSQWSCPIDGAAMTSLHAFANDGDIVERIVCACGHVRQRKVGRVLPDEHFDAIGRRLELLARSEEWCRDKKPRRWVA